MYSVSVRVARSFAEVEALRGVWSAWPSHRDSDIDFCMDFGWRRKQVLRPHVFVLYRDGQVDALLVGWIEEVRLKPQIGYLHLPGIKARLLNFSYDAFLGNTSEENCRAMVDAVRDALRQGEADMAWLDHLRVEGLLYEIATNAAGFATRDHMIQPDAHWLMEIAPTFEKVFQGFSSGLRAEIRRKKKKMLADFGEKVKMRCYRRVEELDEAIPQLEHVAKLTYQRGLGVGFSDTPEMRQRLQFCAEKGWLRIYVVTIDGVPSAFWIGTLARQVFISDYNGYDPKFRNYSIGTCLLIDVVEEFCREGVKAIDFGFGEAEYKERFSNKRLIEAPVRFFAPRAKGVFLNGMLTATGRADRWMKHALGKANLLPRIKRFWRQRAAQGNAEGKVSQTEQASQKS